MLQLGNILPETLTFSRQGASWDRQGRSEINPAPGRHYVLSEGAPKGQAQHKEHADMSLNRIRILFVSLLAVFVLSALMVSVASAAESPEWWVAGSLLKG